MLTHLSLEAFGNATASEEAVPGGGSVSALAGSLAAALTAMVAGLTRKKERFATVAPQMAAVEEHALQLQNQLMSAVDRDAESYRQVLKAFRLPKTTEKEKAARSRAIQTAYEQAIDVPLEVAQLSEQIMDLAIEAIEKGSPVMISDAGVALLMARSAALGALMNVRINLTGLKDPSKVSELEARAVRIKNNVLAKEQAGVEGLPL